MNSGKICISISAPTVDEFIEKIKAADERADLIEVRFDRLEFQDAMRLLTNLPAIKARYLLTYRPFDEGGFRELSLSARIKFWKNALSTFGHDLMIDVETDQELLATIPGNVDQIVSLHRFEKDAFDVKEAWREISPLSDGVVKIAIAVDEAHKAVDLWKLFPLARAAGREVIPIAMGEAGKWTRILGPAHGAYLTYTALSADVPTAPGQLTIAEAIDVYRVKELDPHTEVYGIIAGDTSYSMSPHIHNAAFKSSGRDAVFVPLQVTDLDQFVRRMVRPETSQIELNFHGFSVTNPHKRSISKYLDLIDDAAQRIGAVNTVKIIEGTLHGFNTDADGFIKPLIAKFGDLKKANVALVGAGGVARACVFALKTHGSTVTVFARHPEKAAILAEDFGVDVRKLTAHTTDFSGFDILVNVTPLGTRGEKVDETFAFADQLKGLKLVYDVVYNPANTRLLREARLAGAEQLGGFDMLVEQAALQFQLWTGLKAPKHIMKAAVRKRLDES